MTSYIFHTPTVDEGYSTRGLWRYLKETRGVSVVKSGGTYSLKRNMTDEDAHDYDELYLGGYQHTVDAATKAALIAGGIGVTEANFTAI